MINQKFLLKIIEKWPAKVLSIAAALIISIFYRMNTLEIRHFTVPLNVIHNTGFLSVDSFENSVRISLRGEPGGIHSILEDDIEAYIDLNKYTNEGVYRVPVQIRKKGSALGVEPLEISVIPVEVPVTLERKVTRDIPVYPVFRGAVEYGYELTNHFTVPDRVTAEGPRSTLDIQYQFNTEAIDLANRYGDFSVIVSIVNDDPLVNIHGNRMIEYHGSIRRITSRVPIMGGSDEELAEMEWH